MELLPAIDLRDGKVVRLERGAYDRQITYADDPAAVARRFVEAGARWIHVVDLDAARSGLRTNGPAIRAVAEQANPAATPRVRIQCGGGVRNRRAVLEAFALGVDRVVIGSAALKDWDGFTALLDDPEIDPARIALGLDARDGKVAAEGWTEQLETPAADLARRVRGTGLAAIVYTDIARDGMLTGVNVEATARMVEATDVGVIASGGVSGIEDVEACGRIGCAGVIVGKAWYEGRIDLKKAVEVAGRH